MAAPPVTLPRRSKGPKPQFFRDPALDHLMAMVVALTAELSVAIERHDTMERLLDKAGVLSRKAIEAFRPDEAIEAERFKVRDDLIGRVFHILHEQAELAQTMGKSTKDLSYVADDRGAVLGGAGDFATLKVTAAASRRPVPAAAKAAAAKARPKAAAKKKAATRKPARKAKR